MKLEAYYKLLQSYPSPVLPLFGSERHYFIQRIDAERKVVAFEPIDSVDRERVIIDKIDATELNIGQRALFAIAVTPKHVSSGTYSNLQRTIRDQVDIAALNPFIALELSMFLGDNEMIELSAFKCKAKLAAENLNLAKGWIAGAPVNEALKARLLESAEADQAATSPLSGIVRFGFSGPWLFMRAMTAYCERTYRRRSTVIRSAIEKKDSAETIVNLGQHLDSCLTMLIEKREQPNVKYMNISSRGSLYMYAFDFEKYSAARKSFRAAMRTSEFFDRYRRTSMYSSGEEHLSYLIAVCIFMQSFSEFRQFFSEYKLG